jgi:hypothetical protein
MKNLAGGLPWRLQHSASNSAGTVKTQNTNTVHLPKVHSEPLYNLAHLLFHAAITTFFLLVISNMLLFGAMQVISLPFTRVAQQNLGLQTQQSFYNSLETIQQQLIVELPGNDNSTLTLRSLGVNIDKQQLWESQQHINGFWDLPLFRLVTNSSLNQQVSFTIDDGVMKRALTAHTKEELIPAQNASLIIDGPQKVVLTPETPGSQINAELVKENLLARLQAVSQVAPIQLKSKAITADTTSQQLQPLEQQALKAFAAQQIDFIHQDTVVASLDSQTLAELMQVDESDEKPRLKIDPLGLEYWADEFVRPSTETPATAERKTGASVTQTGKPGSMIQMEELQARIERALATSLFQVEVPLVEEEHITIQDGVYPKNSQGLQALIEDYDAKTASKNWVVVQQLRGGNLRARHGAFTKVIPASTYKAFLAYAVLKNVEAGSLTMSSPMHNTTVENCIYIMVHYSTNECALAFLRHLGYEKVDQLLLEAGFRNTTLNNPRYADDKWTTAYDEYKLFRGYYDGSLLSKEHTDFMLNLFKKQSFRTGIPAASAPDVVADKIGFFGNFTHDAGIVYGDEYDYILIVMTEGGSFWSINTLAKQVNQLFRQ